MNELKPCPFCGGNAKLYIAKYGNSANDYAKAFCINCGAEIKRNICVDHSATDEAIKAWNRRETGET